MIEFSGQIPILNVKDVAASIDYYVTKLGFEMRWRVGDFSKVGRGKTAIFLCQGGQGPAGVWMSVFLDDVDALHEEYKKTGARILEDPMNFPWGHREMLVEDLDGHVMRMSGEPTGPPTEDWQKIRGPHEVRKP
jgi:catechol 2,3-dioxygenase-like lactoylglutathione lyase family enzyme